MNLKTLNTVKFLSQIKVMVKYEGGKGGGRGGYESRFYVFFKIVFHDKKFRPFRAHENTLTHPQVC
jgi:hypothetical protein